ncbi:hypothetical protein RQ479_08880 [Mesorhizobium sp. ISC25]|uniref:hypothetical protein n=1 Tax=Mesorhizobium sp. ISC25 TaxID=3077335 RepID=UPI0035DC50F4
MPEDLRLGRIIHGIADANSLRDEMVIVFDQSIGSVRETDMLVVAIAEKKITLHVIDNQGDNVAVSGPSPDKGSWNFALDRRDGNTWVVRLEPQHIEQLEWDRKRHLR